MDKKKQGIILLIILIIVLIIINYSFLDKLLINFLDDSQTGVVERVIDGDTIVINGTSVRMLGINTPERGERYYSEAKDFLNTLVLNKTVSLKFGKDKLDKYGRTLAYVFLGNAPINRRMIEEGFANYYFPSGKDGYYEEFVEAWERCLDGGKNLCKKSDDVCRDCFTIEVEKEWVIIKNGCIYPCDMTDWIVRNEGRKKVVFNATILYSGREIVLEIPLTAIGDTVFLRDKKNDFVISKTYNK